MKFIKENFVDDEILLMYKWGSYAFGLNEENSDQDYVVVLKDFKGVMNSTHEDKDYFIFGLNTWKRKMEFSDSLDCYFEAFNDETLAFPDNILTGSDELLILADTYKKAFASKYKIWLKKVVKYFDLYFKLGDLNKDMYHLLRIRFMVENYKKSGSFSLELSKELKQRIIKYKTVTNKEEFRAEINDALNYLIKETED